jgi:hypothetical protein
MAAKRDFIDFEVSEIGGERFAATGRSFRDRDGFA